MKKEIYISFDVESNGPIPGEFSILSVGAITLTPQGQELGTFYANLDPLPGAQQDPDTMNWREKNQSAYDATRVNTLDPALAMKNFVDWVNQFPYQPVAVASPAGYDWTFLYWYLIKFAGISPFSFSCLDMKTLAISLMKTTYRKSNKRNWPKHWHSNFPHTHNGLDDAREQGHSFIFMLNDMHRSKKF
jgi:hypothetical protein